MYLKNPVCQSTSHLFDGMWPGILTGLKPGGKVECPNCSAVWEVVSTSEGLDIDFPDE